MLSLSRGKHGVGEDGAGPLRLQHPCDLLEPGEGQISGLAQILLAHLLARAQVRIPVALPTLHGFQQGAEGALLTLKSKGRPLGQPGKPGGTLRRNGAVLPAVWLGQDIDLESGRPTQLCFGLGHSIPLVDQPTHGFLRMVTAHDVTAEMFLTGVYLFPHAIASQGR